MEFSEACERAKTTRNTLDEVFINDVMRSTKRNGYRKKRNLLAVGGFAAGLVMSIYNSVEISRPSTEVEDLKQKQEFLIEDLEEVKQEVKEHNMKMKHLEESFNKIREIATVGQYENLLMMMTTLFRSEIRDKRDMVLRMAEGIYKGFSGTVSPSIMNNMNNNMNH